MLDEQEAARKKEAGRTAPKAKTEAQPVKQEEKAVEEVEQPVE